MKGISLTYEAAVTGVGNYLSAKVDDRINNYQMKMLENNKIPGLLPARGSMFNSAYQINYEIDGTRRLAAVLADGSLRGQKARNFMADFLYTLSRLGDYFLSYMQCLLDIDYIYVDSRNQAKFVYLPLSGQVITDEEKVRQFCLRLFVEYFTADGDPFFLKLLRYVSMQDFSFAGLIEWFKGNEESAANEQEGKQDLWMAQSGIDPRPSQTFQRESNLQVPRGFDNGKNLQILQNGQDFLSVEGKNNLTQEQISLQNNNVPGQGNVSSGQEKRKLGLFHKDTAAKAEKENDAAPGFAVPGGGFAVPKGAEERKKKETKPGKEKGGSLFKAILAGKKDKAVEEKAAGVATFAQQNSLHTTGLPNPEDYNGMRNRGKAGGENHSGDWQGTVIMKEDESSDTFVMCVNAAPYLSYQGMKISLEHFPFTIGKENTDFVIERNVVSRMHASINCREEGYFVMDENSKNHTWLNGRQLSPYTETPLQDGDTLRLANEIMTFHI